MKKKKFDLFKILKSIIKYFLIVFLILLILFAIFVRMGPGNQSEELPNGLIMEIKEYDNYNFSYVRTQNNKDKAIIFIHGTPGSWGAFSNYMLNPDLLDEYEMYSVNRLGFGKSIIKNSKYETSYEIQAEPIIKLIKEIKSVNKNSQIVLVGHSLGVSISKRIYYDSPENISAMILLAGNVYSENGKQRWYNIISNNFLGNFIIGKDMMIANKEVVATKSELEIIEDAFNDVKISLIYIQAENDMIVTPRNLDYIENIENDNIKVMRLDDGNHFIPWNKENLITVELLNLFK